MLTSSNTNEPTIFWIDLFCGAGGTTTGIHLANANAKVIACVNHDQKAIESHKANHPDCLHLTEDIRDFKVVQHLKKLVNNLRNKNPECIINIWASLECTNYSKAKGGLPRDADSRTLANHLFMYLEHLDPEYLYIENVREFMSWGALDKNGKPISRRNGSDYIKWSNSIQDYGYNYQHKLLNAADFGAYTTRVRYFGIFAKKGLPISFPEPTHVKELPEKNGLFKSDLKKWKPVKEVLDLEDKGKTIFDRKIPLSENTLKRIYAGLIKFVAGGEEQFTKVYNSGNDLQRVKSVNGPIGSLTTQNSHAVVSSDFLYHIHGGCPKSKVWSVNKPNRTVTGSGNHYKVSTSFIKKYFSGRPEGKVIGINNPAGTITTVGGQALVQSEFLTSYYGNGMPHNINQPCPTVTTKDRFALYSNTWLTDTQYNRVGQEITKPCFTLIARMDKKPPYLIQTEKGELGIIIYDSDNETMVKIKEFMALYGIIDIKMRMLLIKELKAIQGFPKDYILKGTKRDQKKFIGNSVETNQAKMLVESNYNSYKKHLKIAV